MWYRIKWRTAATYCETEFLPTDILTPVLIETVDASPVCKGVGPCTHHPGPSLESQVACPGPSSYHPASGQLLLSCAVLVT